MPGGAVAEAAPSLSLPRFTGEGTLAIGFLDEGHNLPPLPRSGGGLGRGQSSATNPAADFRREAIQEAGTPRPRSAGSVGK